MKLSIATILLFWTHSLFGQLQTDIKVNLTKKNYSEFKKFADTLTNKINNVRAYFEVERDITKGFQEIIWVAEKSVPDSDRLNISTVYTFRLNLITADNTIIYYDLQKRKSKKVNGDWISYYPTIEKFRNDTLYAILENQFRKSFGDKLNSSDLFIDTVVYGESCGDGVYDGDDPVEEAKYASPKEDYILKNFIKNKNKNALLGLIHSANTEKQLYGVKGLLEMQKQGIKLTHQETEIIKNILTKSGTVRTCSGCSYDRRKISEIAKEFTF